MSVPSLPMQPVSTSHYFISGDVTIQAGVAIAPGVLIQADPGSRVVIQTGACIGIGSVLHAHSGLLEVGAGASIGSGVLLLGCVLIGANACIGAATTIFNANVAAEQIIPAGSLVGEMGRQADELYATDTVLYPAAEDVSPTQAAPEAPPPEPSVNAPPEAPSELAVEPPAKAAPEVNVYGQMYVNQLLVKLFPHRQHNSATTNGTASAETTADPWAD